MLHLFIIPHVQTQSNRFCNFSNVILLWLMLPRDHLGGLRDVAQNIHYPSCTDSIKPSLQDKTLICRQKVFFIWVYNKIGPDRYFCFHFFSCKSHIHISYTALNYDWLKRMHTNLVQRSIKFLDMSGQKSSSFPCTNLSWHF
jgi:hypothetical protein